MLRDAIGLIVAFFILIVEYIVTSSFFVQLIYMITSLNKKSAMFDLAIQGVYLMIHGIVALGIIMWYLHRSHREEVETDYFTQSGWVFQMPNYMRYNSRRRW